MTTKFNSIYSFSEDQELLVASYLTKGSKKTFNPEILLDPRYSKECEGTGPLEIPDDPDLDAYTAATIVHSSLKQAVPSVQLTFNDIGLWQWLSLAFYKQFIKKPGDITRYSPAVSGKSNWTRHLLRSSVWLYDKFGEDSKIYLSKPLYYGTDLNESWTQSIALVKYNMAKLLHLLYFDDEKQTRKKGINDKKPGEHRDLLAFIKQLRYTYKVEEFSAEEIYEKLPERFDRWKK